MDLRTILRAMVLSLAAIGTAEAGSINDLQLFDGTGGSPTVTIDYTNADGTGSNSAYVYADPQVSNGTTTPMYYCVDLWHDNYLGSTYTITPVTSMAFSTSTFSDVDNRIGWLLTQPQDTPDGRAAVQLAIWYTVDNVNSGFSFSGGDATLNSDYNTLISFSGYNPAVNYSADFFQATHDSTNTLYQNLVCEHGNFNSQSVPEPGSIVMAGIALLSLAGVGLRQRMS
ncbi:MAG: Cys-Gln thioester bond-forming surface protein [Isosphaeraceae bacterium]